MSEQKINKDIPDFSNDPDVEEMIITVDPAQTQVRIDKFLMERLYKVSRNKVQQAIVEGKILVDEKMVKSNFKVKGGMVIKLFIPKAGKTEVWVKPQPMDLDIRYEDDQVMVIHKPAGLVVHPGIGIKDGTLVNGLAHYFEGKELPVAEGNTPDRPGLVHRIDKETSGLMVIAKTETALTHLAKQFFDHSVERKYIALIWGEPDEQEGTIDAHIGRDPKNRTKRKSFPDGDEGKHAITHWKMLEPMYYVSLVECQLETGRTHQIRVHFSGIGHPLFNDKKYDGNRIRKGTVYTKYRQFVENGFKLLPRQALHAQVIGFTHPETGERLRFEAELPEDFQSALDKWRGYIAGRSNQV